MTNQFVKCDECGKDIPWDKVHRFKDNDRKITKLCSDCCTRCGEKREEDHSQYRVTAINWAAKLLRS